jgi:hypothetical protein
MDGRRELPCNSHRKAIRIPPNRCLIKIGYRSFRAKKKTLNIMSTLLILLSVVFLAFGAIPKQSFQDPSDIPTSAKAELWTCQG